MLYPLKFYPIFKEKIWGGQKIRTLLNKDFSPLRNCGESWEISGVEGNLSVVREGSLKGKDLRSLIGEFGGKIVGNRIFRQYGKDFPLLVKFIDANDDLSIQVHPGDELAIKRHGSFGKTEMWYVLQADEGSSLITGFNRPVDRDIYLQYFRQGNLMDILNREQVRARDTFFIPAGRVHTIGTGLLLAEIQQTSDVTYRIYDFDRVDAEGNKRALHLDQAMDAIDFSYYPEYRTQYDDRLNEPVLLASCDYFTTNKLKIGNSVIRSYENLDSFVILICVDGTGVVVSDDREYPFTLGDAVLIPAEIKSILLKSEGMEVLETYVTPDEE